MRTQGGTPAGRGGAREGLCAPPRPAPAPSHATEQGSGWLPRPGAIPPAQMTAASSWWLQLCLPQGSARQRRSAGSVPSQFTSSSQTGPVPGPKWALRGASRATPQPSSRQTTAASGSPQLSSQTVPQRPACSTSTRPAQRPGPPAKRSWAGAEKELGVTPLLATSVWGRGLCPCSFITASLLLPRAPALLQHQLLPFSVHVHAK